MANVFSFTSEISLILSFSLSIFETALHRMGNIGNEMVEFVESQICDYLGEDDIVRYEDDFGRA